MRASGVVNIGTFGGDCLTCCRYSAKDGAAETGSVGQPTRYPAIATSISAGFGS